MIRCAIICCSLKPCFSLLLIFIKLQLSLRIFLKFGKVWLYLMTKEIWVDFSFFFACYFWTLRQLNWSSIVASFSLARCFVTLLVSVQMFEMRRAWEYGIFFLKDALREKCPYSEFFWSVFSRIRTEYGEILRISPYSVRMR